MKCAPPITITDAMLVSSNVSEGPAADYAGGTTYAAGAVVSGVTTASLKIQYASLQSGNVGHTPGASGSETWWRAIGYAANAYSAGTTYAASDGAQIDTGGVHQLWWSVVDANLGNDPQADAGDHWLFQSATNYWAMFDLGLGFTTGNTRIATRWGGKIDVTLAPTAALDTVVAWIIDADSVQVTVTNASSVVIYDQTVTLTGDTTQIKWQLDGVAHLRPVQFEGVTFTAGSQVRVQIVKSGGVAVCAELILGLGIDVGATLAPANVGIVDYSPVKANDFGALQKKPGVWHRKGSFNVRIAESDVDACLEFLTLYRGKPMQFIGSDVYRSTSVFGYIMSFEVVITFPGVTTLQIDLESV